MKIIDIKQGSQEWLQARLGKITGTTLKDAVGKDNLKLIDTLIAEKLSNESKEVTPSRDMERGIDEEPQARKEFEKQTGLKVKEIGFVQSDEFDFLGCSPDGLIGEDIFTAGAEFKCPSSSKHIEYIRINRIPSEYRYQILNYFLVCDTIDKVYFVSYDRRILIKPLHIVEITRQEVEEELKEIREELKKFKEKFDKYYLALTF